MPDGKKRTRLRGTVTSTKMDKTVIVTVTRRVQHPFYKKHIDLSKRYPAHDEQNRCKNGDLVEIVSTRPLSKTKRWAVIKVLKPVGPSLTPELAEQEALP